VARWGDQTEVLFGRVVKWFGAWICLWLGNIQHLAGYDEVLGSASASALALHSLWFSYPPAQMLFDEINESKRKAGHRLGYAAKINN
jgi:hypothetical protein